MRTWGSPLSARTDESLLFVVVGVCVWIDLLFMNVGWSVFWWFSRRPGAAKPRPDPSVGGSDFLHEFLERNELVFGNVGGGNVAFDELAV